MSDTKESNVRMISELGTAIRTEAEGHLFYSEAAKLTEDPKGREVFLHLASEELEHMHVIIALVEALESGEEWPYYPDALAEGMKKEHPVFPGAEELKKKLKEDWTDRGALEIAIKSEGEALRAYLELLKMATTPREKVVLTRLLEMERSHQKVLRWELESLDEQGFWCGIMDYSVEKEIG